MMRPNGVRWRSLLALSLAVVAALDLTGCGPQWRKKFIRKRKTAAAPPQAVLVLQKDFQVIHPPEVRYQEHFAYWKSWHTDLLDSLGQSRKRDLRYLDGTIGELRSMADLLTGPQARRMKEILEEMGELQGGWARAPEPWRVAATTRGQLERIRREVDKGFHYSKVKEALVAPADQR